jgi:hypothetical protein
MSSPIRSAIRHRSVHGVDDRPKRPARILHFRDCPGRRKPASNAVERGCGAADLLPHRTRTANAHVGRRREQSDHLGLVQRLLHASASTVHCATHAPDNPQFCAQEKLVALQFATHTSGVWAWASLSRSRNVAASLDTRPESRISNVKMCLTPTSRTMRRVGSHSQADVERRRRLRTPILAFVSKFTIPAYLPSTGVTLARRSAKWPPAGLPRARSYGSRQPQSRLNLKAWGTRRSEPHAALAECRTGSRPPTSTQAGAASHSGPSGRDRRRLSLRST